MRQAFKIFIFGMTTMSIIAGLMSAFGAGAEEAPVAACLLVAKNGSRLLLDTGLIRARLEGQSELFAASLPEVHRKLMAPAHFKAYLEDSTLRLSMHFGKSAEIAGRATDAAASGFATGPVTLEAKLPNGSMVTLDCQVEK